MSQFLESLGLHEFTPRFMKHGFDRVQDVLCLDDQDLVLVIPDEKKRGNFITTLRKGTIVSQEVVDATLWANKYPNCP